MQTQRTRLPATRRSITCKRNICGFEVYIIIGFFDDGTVDSDTTLARPGEIFLKLTKHGSEMSGVMDAFSILLSMAFQYGLPWDELKTKLIGMRFGQEDETYLSLIDGIARCIDEQINARRALLDPDK